ncbi:MAG: transposase, partial [Deltaproteobacteria bacterium]|nr:transposase [Deltaproteobacteria bacterium]
NPALFIRFMGRLVKDAGRKVFLVVDNLKTHHGKMVRQWVAGHAEEIEVFACRRIRRSCTPMNTLTAA